MLIYCRLSEWAPGRWMPARTGYRAREERRPASIVVRGGGYYQVGGLVGTYLVREWREDEYGDLCVEESDLVRLEGEEEEAAALAREAALWEEVPSALTT